VAGSSASDGIDGSPPLGAASGRLEADLLHADLERARRGQHGRGALLFLDEGGDLHVHVPLAGVDLLDLLEDGDGLGREPFSGELIGEGGQVDHRLAALAGQDQHVGELEAEARVRVLAVGLGAKDFDGLRVVLLGDQSDDVVAFRLAEAQRHPDSCLLAEETTAGGAGCQRSVFTIGLRVWIRAR
jgi:hypothetical protein